MRGRATIVKDIRGVYADLSPFRALRTSNKVPLAVDVFSVLKTLNSLHLSMFQFFVLSSIHELNMASIPVRPLAYHALADRRQINDTFQALKKRGLIERIEFNPMLTHTVERATKCYQLTDKGRKLIASYNYLVKDTQKQAKNARLKYIDGQ